MSRGRQKADDPGREFADEHDRRGTSAFLLRILSPIIARDEPAHRLRIRKPAGQKLPKDAISKNGWIRQTGKTAGR